MLTCVKNVGRIDTKHWTITYAGSPKLSKSRILKFFQDEQIGTLKPDYCIVSEEVSSDPKKGTHFHVYLRYPRRKNLINMRAFDIDGFHPNIQRTKSVKDYVEYLKKEDVNPLSFGEFDKPPIPEDIMNDRQTFNKYFRSLMEANPFTFDLKKYIFTHRWDLKGKSGFMSWINDFNVGQEVWASIILQNKPRILKRMDKRKHRTLIRKWEGYGTIIDYINRIVECDNSSEDRMWPIKHPHLFLVGRPNIGKSSLVTALGDYFSIYPFGSADRWWPRYTIFTYSIINWDEFTLSSKAMSFGELLKLLGGQQMNLPVKGTNVFKIDRQAFILTSNETLEKHISLRFTKTNQRKDLEPALRARINELIIPKGIDLFPLIDLLSKYTTKKI